MSEYSSSPEAPFRPYDPKHKATEDYVRGMELLRQGQIAEAAEVLRAEPPESPCHVLALGNASMCLWRLGRYSEGEDMGRRVRVLCETSGCPHPPSAVQFTRVTADCVSGQGRPMEAFKLYKEAIDIADRVAEENVEYRSACLQEKAHILVSIASSLLHTGREELFDEYYDMAKQIYASCPEKHETGYAEVLANLALCMRERNPLRASLALKEALSVAELHGDADQSHRIKLHMVQFCLCDDGLDRDTVIAEAVQNAEESENHAVAYLRCCIAANIYYDAGQWKNGLGYVRRASRIESQLDDWDPSVAKLRLPHALLVREMGEGLKEQIQIALDGASRLLELFNRKLIPQDMRWSGGVLHQQFRLLARCLLEDDRPDEALVAFEAGRAIAFSRELDQALVRELLSDSVFDPKQGKVHTAITAKLSESLPPDSVAIVFADLHPEIVAFIVGKQGIEVVRVNRGSSAKETDELLAQVRALPSKLHKGRGVDAVPPLLLAMSEKIAQVVGDRQIAVVIPYSYLHAVPFRALLVHCGLEFSQMPCCTAFSIVGAILARPLHITQGSRARTMGYGSSGLIDLADEAREFASQLATGKFETKCDRSTMALALVSADLAMVSCHGTFASTPTGREFTLMLADGAVPLAKLLPKKVKCSLLILSACDSGVYELGKGDYPMGGAPQALLAGADYCLCTRFRVDARFIKDLLVRFAQLLKSGDEVRNALAAALADVADDYDQWKDLACIELLAR